MSRIELPIWTGELGWEVMTWAPFCRQQAIGHDEVVVTSFAGMAPLYADFATEFRNNGLAGRSLDYPKWYRVDGLYYCYGRAEQADYSFDVLIHARGVRRKAAINYRAWPAFVDARQLKPWSLAWIGSKEDYAAATCGYDLRGLELQKLMNVIAASRVVIGASSGVMHLAAACGCDLVVWGDRRTYFGETLEQRYKVTWNPFNVKIGWIDADNWQPEPHQIIEHIERILP